MEWRRTHHAETLPGRPVALRRQDGGVVLSERIRCASGAGAAAAQLRRVVRSYGAWGAACLAVDVLFTKVRFPRARLIRRPAFIRGAQWIVLGHRFTSGRCLRMEALGEPSGGSKQIAIGNDVQVNDYVHIAAVRSVSIGDRVLIASRVFITDHNHGSYQGASQSDPAVPPIDRPLWSAPVAIEEDVWIGENVSILPGVRIGRGAIVGTMSTVTRDVPQYCIAVGSPARVVKSYNFQSGQWERV